MRGFQHYRNTLRFQVVHYEIGYLESQSFLGLEPAGKTVNDTGQFAYTENRAGRQVRDVSRANERHQMMLANAVKRYVTQQDYFIVVLRKDAFEVYFRVFMHSTQQFRVHSRNSLGRFLQSLALNVHADCQKDFLYSFLYPLAIYYLAFLSHFFNKKAIKRRDSPSTK